MNKEEAEKRAIELLKSVNIPMPETMIKRFPHELSGGMRQRVMITMAIACNPRLIIADEPTTALDVTIQAQILEILRNIKNEFGGSIMLITHDLGVIAEMADCVVVMYAGKVIETGTTDEIFYNPLHPYTKGLHKSKPTIQDGGGRLFSIKGSVPNPINMPSHCYFYDRCAERCDGCLQGKPTLVKVSPTHSVSCYLHTKSVENDNINDADLDTKIEDGGTKNG